MATKRDFTTTYGLQSDKSGAGTNTLVVDSVNDRVGIGGVTTPTVTLQLPTNGSISNLNTSTNFGTTLGATGTVAQFYHLNGNASYLRIKATRTTAGADWTTASTKLLQVIDLTEQGYIEFNPNGANSGMAFGTNVTEWARFLQNGNLGIGTTNPQDKVEINSLNGTDVKLRLATNASTFSNFTVIRGVRVSDSQSSLEFQVNNGGVQTGLVIAQNGIVTIGQQSSTKLTVVGNSADQGALTAQQGSLLNIVSNTALAANTGGSITLGGIVTSTITRAFGVIKGYKENATDSDAKGYLSFSINTGGAIFEALRINSSGNLGIGTTTPSFKADIAGDARITSTNRMRFGGTAGTTNFYIQYNSTANSLDFVAG